MWTAIFIGLAIEFNINDKTVVGSSHLFHPEESNGKHRRDQLPQQVLADNLTSYNHFNLGFAKLQSN